MKKKLSFIFFGIAMILCLTSLAACGGVVDAQTPVITSQPQGAAVTAGGAHTLSVAANVTDGGALSYQWYSNTTNSASGGTAISTATGATYSVPAAATGTFYYYAVVTNTNSSAGGNKTATTTSAVATVKINALVNAQAPAITAQPQGATVTTGAAHSINITATVSDGGTLSYQWYSNTNNSTSGGTAISAATSPAFSVPTTIAGTFYYYVVVTNTNSGANGSKTATTTSAAAAVTVNPLVNAQAPVMTSQPQGATIYAGTTCTLRITANISDGGVLSYQWFSSTTNSTSGGTAISNATSAAYSVPTYSTGTFYYYVVVTNTNSGVNGSKTVTTSTVAAVYVFALPVNTVNAQTPVIAAQPQGASLTAGGVHILSITAGVTDGGALSYQWFSNTVNSTSGGSLISGATNATYSVPTAAAGTLYYYVIITNTNSGVNGARTATVTSGAAAVTVNALVNAQTPVITVQPQGTSVTAGEAHTLSITAGVTDGGTLSYQWFSNTVNSTSGGSIISGATNATYSAPLSSMGTRYYYAVITNTLADNGDGGTKTAAATSSVVAVTALVHAQYPAFTSQPSGASVSKNGSCTLSVGISVTDTLSHISGGSLSYQWYSNTTNGVTGGTAITGATGSSYSPSTGTMGTMYYYVIVTHTNNDVNGTTTASSTSNIVAVTVVVNAQAPAVTAQPQSATVPAGTAHSLSVTANATDNCTLSYQWYSNTANSSSGGTVISGATGASFAVPTTAGGILYYYVIVTGTDNNLNGNQTATVTSAVAVITRSYTITWSVNGATSTTAVAYGSTPAYGATPAKPDTDENSYTFDCWSPQITPVTGEATYTAVFTPVAKGMQRSNPIILRLSTRTTAVITGSETIFDGKCGKWYCYTPDVTGIYVIKATAYAENCCVYMFDSPSGTEIAFSDDDSIDFRFRLEYELTADTTYYFFVAFVYAGSGDITFEIFPLISVAELVETINTASGDAYLKAVTELYDMRLYSEALDALLVFDTSKLEVLAADGNFDAAYLLMALDVYLGSPAAAGAYSNTISAYIALVESGDLDAVSILFRLAFYGDTSAINALGSINPDALKTLAEAGNQFAADALMGLVFYGNYDAWDALAQLDITTLLNLAKTADIKAIDLLMQLTGYNTDAMDSVPELIAALKGLVEDGNIGAYEALSLLYNNWWVNEAYDALNTLDASVLGTLAAAGDMDRINTLIALFDYFSNTGAADVLNKLNVSAYRAAAESGDGNTVNMFLDLLNYYGNLSAMNALKTINPAAFITAANNGSFEAIHTLAILADFQNTNARLALKNYDIANIMVLVLSGDSDAADLIALLTLYDNAAAKAAIPEILVFLAAQAQGGSVSAARQIINFAIMGNADAFVLLPDLVPQLIIAAEDGDYAAVYGLMQLVEYCGFDDVRETLRILNIDKMIADIEGGNYGMIMYITLLADGYANAAAIAYIYP